jgi:hypothetical protein
MEVFFHVDNDQEVLHRQCPQVPADKFLVVCSFVVESKERGGPDCHILAATDDVVKEYGGKLNVGANLLAGGLSDPLTSATWTAHQAIPERRAAKPKDFCFSTDVEALAKEWREGVLA